MLFVSHDRYLINRVATRVLALTEGTFLSCDGNYDDYLEQKDALEAAYLSGGSEADAPGEAEKAEAVTAAKADWQEQKERAAKARKYEKDLSQTEARIEELEKRKAEIHDLFTQEEIFTDHEKLRALQEELDGLEAEQNDLYEKWEDLLSQNEIME